MRRTSLVALLAVAVALLALPSGASAAANKCTNPLYGKYECIVTTGTGLTVDSISSHFWLLPGNSWSGSGSHGLRITKPNGNVTKVFYDVGHVSCSAGALPFLCSSHTFNQYAGSYPDGTELCTGFFSVTSSGKHNLVSGWACADVHA